LAKEEEKEQSFLATDIDLRLCEETAGRIPEEV